MEAAIHYRWSYETKPQAGKLALRQDGTDCSDSWHSPTRMGCPSDELLLQMTNVAPWGDEARAVRMICKRG